MPRERRAGSRLAAVLDQVRAGLDQGWTVERLSHAAALSPRALHRHFVAATGLSPGAWLGAERLVRARELLEEPDASLEDVALACGFGGTAAMRHHFRLGLGVSPAAYRAGARGARP